MRVLAIITILLLLLTATACHASLEDVKKDSEYAKACREGGGHVWYNDFGIQCHFEEEK